jgi:hypothetical protein
MWYRTKVSGSWAFTTVNGSGVASPNNASALIPPMQAFWVRASTVGNSTLDLTNNMVSHDNNATNKLKAPAAERQMVRLQVSNAVNTDELVIYTDSRALNTFDTFDSPKMSNEAEDFPEISSVVDSENLVINGLNSLISDTEMPVHFMTKTANTFTLRANQVSNLPEGYKVILKDNETEFDLTNGNVYTFSSGVADDADRFSLVFRSPGVTTNLNGPATEVFVHASHHAISIFNNSIQSEVNVQVFNTFGQLVHAQQLSKNNETLNKVFAPGVYMVTTKINNQPVNAKVIVK